VFAFREFALPPLPNSIGGIMMKGRGIAEHGWLEREPGGWVEMSTRRILLAAGWLRECERDG